MSFIQQLSTNLRAADVLDVAVIALLLYCGLAWFRERASRSMLVGLALVAALFLVAQWLGMYLTSMLFRVGFLMVAFALIVVFQQDIRRALERLAASDWFQRGPVDAPNVQVVETLVESIATLAQRRIGALLVFKGREPLDQHVRGGVDVDAHISLPLLYSIFHPATPGHDGAVFISGDRLERLGVHLPLSQDLSQTAATGTRHAAALGLSERCDALVVAVSEERGTITVAERGRMRQIQSVQLSELLQDRYRDREPAKLRGSLYNRLAENAWLKLTSLAMACALWLLFAYRVETLQRTFTVPIEYRNLPEQWVVDEPRPTQAELTLSGSERAFDLLNANSLAVSLDLSHVRSETLYSIRAADSLKNVPAQLTVNQIRPAEIKLSVSRKRPPEGGP